jgi:hypothetical protein
MHFRKLLLVVIAVAIVTFSAGLRGQGLIDGIKVTLPHAVTVGEKVLEPGEYEIRRPSSVNRDILQIFSKDKMVYETNVLTVATGPDEKDPKETKVVLHHIGDAYYFDKIWMEDRNYGWEFPLPERARALQREAALSVPARFQTAQLQTSEQVAQPASPPYEGPGLAAQLDAIAAQDEQQAAALSADRERELQAQRDRELQAQRDRELAERNQVAAVQSEPAPAAPPQSESRVTESQSLQRSEEIPEQLPETATNWAALLLGGGLLITLSLILRPVRA